jgi:Transmembrane protein 43
LWKVGCSGFLSIFIAINTLHWNETRVNMASLAHESVDASTTAATQGQLVSVTGPILTNLPLGDDRFLRPGNYVAVDRTVEMYSWKESKQIQRQKKLGGSEIETTTYTYTGGWTLDPQDSSKFAHAAAYRNPPKAIPDR